jgi:hypothetical protein
MGNPGDPVYYNTQAVSHEAGSTEEIDLSAFINLLLPGENVLAIQGHNSSLSSSDLSMIPALRWEYAAAPTYYIYLPLILKDKQ